MRSVVSYGHTFFISYNFMMSSLQTITLSEGYQSVMLVNSQSCAIITVTIVELSH